MKTLKIAAVLVLVLSAPVSQAVESSPPLAPVSVFRVVTTGPTRVDDSEGTWTFTGGELRLDSPEGTLIGHFLETRRASFFIRGITGASVTTNFQLIGEDPPQNLTLQGTHGIVSGDQIGSVSAASSDFATVVGAQWEMKDDVYVITP